MTLLNPAWQRFRSFVRFMRRRNWPHPIMLNRNAATFIGMPHPCWAAMKPANAA